MATEIISGQTWQTNSSGFISILANNGCFDVDILFIETGNIKKVRRDHVLRGSVKDNTRPSIFGVGYYGVGKYRAVSSNKTTTEAYEAWRGMLRRCYDDAFKLKRPTYQGCTVCTEWHNFQVFAKWFYDNYTNGLSLDKDLLVDGNKHYSPDTCVFVTNALNCLLSRCDRDFVGVYLMDSGRYKALINIGHKSTHLGTYDTRHQAERVYRHTKATEIVRQALLPSTPKQLFYPLLNKAEELIGNLNRRAK